MLELATLWYLNSNAKSKIQILNGLWITGDTSEDEDTDDALMMTAISEVEAAAAARSQNARIRMRTVSTVR